MATNAQMRAVVADFPTVFPEIVRDWATFKAALATGRVPLNVKTRVLGWYQDFPKLWAGIRPNWETENASDTDKQFAEAVNRFVIRLRGEPVFSDSGLGVAPLIIAGVIVAGLFGAAGLTWGVGYLLERVNIHRLISENAKGNVSDDVLREAIHQEESGVFGGVLGNLKDIAIILLLGGAAWFLLPWFKRTR